MRESLPSCDPPCGLGQGLKTVGFHFTTWPNRNIREISSALLPRTKNAEDFKIFIPFLVLAWPGWALEGTLNNTENWK